MTKLIRSPKAQPKIEVMKCPVCRRSHVEHPEFGNFCCASCLQTVIRPLILERYANG
jgi:protein-arginine kinase activator protein McsA